MRTRDLMRDDTLRELLARAPAAAWAAGAVWVRGSELQVHIIQPVSQRAAPGMGVGGPTESTRHSRPPKKRQLATTSVADQGGQSMGSRRSKRTVVVVL